MEGIGGLQNWQWLFLLEGLPIIPLGIITYLFLGNIPDTVQCKSYIVEELKIFEIILKIEGWTIVKNSY